MEYLVIDLEKSCLNSEMSNINLLRKTLVVAKKLKITDFQSWIMNEMQGYKSIEDIPDYRKVIGQLKGLNPYHGWIPTLLSNDSDMNEMLTTRKVADSVSQIEFLMKSETNELCYQYPGNIENILGKMFGFETKYQLFVSKAQFQGILENVRTIIMNWALELECDGILGEEMMFNDEEKKIADKKNYTVNNFYGDITNSQIQQDVNDSKQQH
ncbi:hypothetical protein [Clostridium sp. ZBS4]|uniref:AbiTii domain-containing protein n=1 Tax=Clostridium sp. ZBS4 TaxID=2949974 RepID=UPI00207A0AE5|nr:hypothetical protein [Clostridium sp. ZBS4]